MRSCFAVLVTRPSALTESYAAPAPNKPNKNHIGVQLRSTMSPAFHHNSWRTSVKTVHSVSAFLFLLCAFFAVAGIRRSER